MRNRPWAPVLAALALAACGESPTIPTSVFAVAAYAGRPLPALLSFAASDSAWLVSSDLTVFTTRATWRRDLQLHHAGQVNNQVSTGDFDFTQRGDSVFLQPRCTGTEGTCALGYVGTTDGVTLYLAFNVTPRPEPLWQFVRTGPLPR